MARLMHPDKSAVFRAVIITTYANGRTYTDHAGPFGAKAPATAAIARAKRDAARDWRGREGATVTGYVERAPLVWERVG